LGFQAVPPSFDRCQPLGQSGHPCALWRPIEHKPDDVPLIDAQRRPDDRSDGYPLSFFTNELTGPRSMDAELPVLDDGSALDVGRLWKRHGCRRRGVHGRYLNALGPPDREVTVVHAAVRCHPPVDIRNGTATEDEQENNREPVHLLAPLLLKS
jgi:hypothetical protein